MRHRVSALIILITSFLSISTNAQIRQILLWPNGVPTKGASQPQTPIAFERAISLEEAIALLYVNNNAIKLTDKSLEIAKAEKQKLNSMWYPYVTATGTYMHFSNNIVAKENEVNSFLNNALSAMQQLFPHLNSQEISGILTGIEGILGGVGSSLSNIVTELNAITLNFPILKQNISTIDANITWPLFTGGKRIFANRIGKSLIATAEEIKSITTDAQLVVLVETYYTLKLSKEIVTEREESVKSMITLFNNAVSLKRNGIINKAEMLVAQVAMEEAIRELENAKESVLVAEDALKTILGIPITEQTKQTIKLSPNTNFFIIKTLPPIEYYKELINSNNSQLQLIKEQQNINKNEKKIAQSAYMPNIAIFAKQTLYSYNIPSNLAPRTVVGAGMVWNIFDGLNREKNIGIAKKNYEQLIITEELTQNSLYLAANKLRSQMMDALNNIRALESTLELSKELLRIREKSFAEGMANSSDVVAARATLSKVRIATLLAYWQFDIALANMTAICGISNQFMELYKSSQYNEENYKL
ncbi:MAG: TolC family protein [Bacteroidales bacterium]